MALIMQAAIQSDAFRTIAAATSYTIPATNKAAARNLTSKFTMTDTGNSGSMRAASVEKRATLRLPEVPWSAQHSEMA